MVPVTGCGGETLDLSNFQPSLTSTGFTYLETPWGAQRMEGISSQRLEKVVSARGLVVYVTNQADRVDRLMERFAEVGGVPRAKEFHMMTTGSLHIPIYTFVVSKEKQF